MSHLSMLIGVVRSVLYEAKRLVERFIQSHALVGS
jgi:hypothetical protein